MNNSIKLVGTLLAGLVISACQQEPQQAAETKQQSGTAPAAVQQPKVVDLMAAPAAPAPSMSNGVATGQVVETIAAAGYTYAKVDVGGQQIWAAGPPTAMKVGDSITFSTAIPMKDFYSKAMERSFPVLYFVDNFSVLSASAGSSSDGGNYHATKPVQMEATTASATLVIEKVSGGYTITEALAQKRELAGKPIKVRGRVIKVTPGIMGRNWLHIVDGSGAEKLIVTTNGIASVGNVIVAQGALGLDRDFGYGYFYEVLMEDAQVSVE